jgi:hypothetical protein
VLRIGSARQTDVPTDGEELDGEELYREDENSGEVFEVIKNSKKGEVFD